MSAPFLDANILVRHITNDDPVQGPACFAIIQAIERGRLTVWTSDLVIAEVVFVLASRNRYNLGRSAIRDILLPLIDLPGIKLANKRLYRRIFDLYTSSSLDFIDAYHVALMEQHQTDEILSYDHHFDHIQGIKRREP